MKQRTVWPLILLLLSCSISFIQANEPIVLLQVNENSPFWAEKNPLGGMGSEIVAAISKEMGINTRIEFIPLKRLISNTSNNDVGNPLFYMYNQDFSAIIPIAMTYSSFFYYHKDAKKLTSKIPNQNTRIGILTGTSSNRVGLEKIGRFEESYTMESLFKKLKAGRVDSVLELNLAGRETISRLFPHETDHFDIHSVPESGAPIAIMIDSHLTDGATIGKRYQEGLHRILKNGVYQNILAKYYNPMQIPKNYYTDLSKFETLYSSDIGGSSL